eukprot:m.151404 g.151404  ORF g.151404 m.151404 type:complete len:171 (+) comp16337_c0_seq9:487-999(+)
MKNITRKQHCINTGTGIPFTSHSIDSDAVPMLGRISRCTQPSWQQSCRSVFFQASNNMTSIGEGIQKRIIKEGSGPTPTKGTNITVHCTGKLADGKKFWSTKDPGQKPFAFDVGIGQVITGWDVGCMTMKKGEIAELTVAGPQAYGASGFPAWGIGPNATLLFEIEILKF